MIAFNNAKLVLLPNPTPYTFFEYHICKSKTITKTEKLKMNCTRTHSRDSKTHFRHLIDRNPQSCFLFNPVLFLQKPSNSTMNFMMRK
jgi:hypothetical protein